MLDERMRFSPEGTTRTSSVPKGRHEPPVRTPQMGQAPIAYAVTHVEDSTTIGASPICCSCRAQCWLTSNRAHAESIFDALQNVFQVGLGNSVVHAPTFFFTLQESAALH
jgi:hypothetical protein